MSIRAKFKCTSVQKFEGGGERVALAPVYGPDGSANKEWSQFTPNGDISMSITAKGAIGKFEPGKEYFVDFTEAIE